MSSCQKNMSTCLLVKKHKQPTCLPVFLSKKPVSMSSCQKHKQPTCLHVFLSKRPVFLSENNLTNLQQYGKKKLGARGGL